MIYEKHGTRAWTSPTKIPNKLYGVNILVGESITASPRQQAGSKNDDFTKIIGSHLHHHQCMSEHASLYYKRSLPIILARLLWYHGSSISNKALLET